MTQWGAQVAGLAALYVGAAKLGIELDVAQGVVTPVWAPTGISIAAVLIFGYRMWPGVAIGAFIANATSDVTPLLAAGIAVGNTAEALVAGYLLRRFNVDQGLGRVRDVILFVALGVVLATAVAATNGVTILAVSDVIGWDLYGRQWFLWWFGDAIGALLVAPVLLTWATHYRLRSRFQNRTEGVALAVVLTVVASVIFLGGRWNYPYVIFPLLVWAALRFGLVGATTAMFIVGGIATWGTVEGAVPIGGATTTESVQILQALVAVVGIAILMIAATVNERATAEHELRGLDEMKNTFISAVSHDLRTPLSTIMGFSHAVREQIDRLSREELVHVLERIESNAIRTSQMLTNLLDLDRLSRDAVEITRTEVDLSDLALRVTQSIEVADREVHVDRHRVIALADAGLLERMIENLLQNAIRHTPRGSPIWVRLREEGDGALIAVEDEGPGVPDEFKKVIFQAFHRGAGQTPTGSGIGLFLVDQFARLHGGRAWVEDRDAGGASFKVELPRVQGDRG